MRNKRLIIALSGAVLCGVLGVMLVTRYLSNVQAYTRDLGNVVVAKNGIQLGEKITADHLMLASIPNGSAPEGAFRKIGDVEGRVAITPIGVRETVTLMKLAPKGVEGGLSAVIPEGYRAMTVKVDDIVGVSGFVMPGSYVDVVAVITPQTTQGQNSGPISKIVLQQIKVLASGPKLDSPDDQREPTNAKSVTLQVTPEQAEKLVLAANEGKLQLVMRNYTDHEASQTRGVNKHTLLNDVVVPELPAPKIEQTERPKTLKTRKPAAPRPVAATVPKNEKPAQPISRNSVELIEGSKRREVDMP